MFNLVNNEKRKALMEQYKHKLLKENDLPKARQQWPDSRSKADYLRLNPFLAAQLAQLPSNAILLDAGMGAGNFLADIKTPHNFTIGCAMHATNPINNATIDCLLYSAMPDGAHATTLINDFRGQIDFITDFYGPSTYAEQPHHVITALTSMLAPGGVAIITVSMVLGEARDESPIGNCFARQRLSRFIESQFQAEMKITRSFIDSAVHDSTGESCVDFSIIIKRKRFVEPVKQSLQSLFDDADRQIGAPTPLPKNNSWGEFEDGAAIVNKRYMQDGFEPITTDIDWPDVLLDCCTRSDIETDCARIEYIFRFNSPDQINVFRLQFQEYLLAQPNSTWTLSGACTLGEEKLTLNATNTVALATDSTRNVAQALNQSHQQLRQSFNISEVKKIEHAKSPSL